MLEFLRRKKLTRRKPSEAIDEVIEIIRPVMREEGFKKNGRTWIKTLDEFSLVINVQASRWNGRDTGAGFVVVYGIYVPSVYQLLFDASNPSRPKEYDCIVGRRISRKGEEIWWDIYDHTEIDRMGGSIIELIKSQCLAYFDSLHSIKDVVRDQDNFNHQFLVTGEFGKAYASGVLYAQAGELVRAKRLLKEASAYSSNKGHRYDDKILDSARAYGIRLN